MSNAYSDMVVCQLYKLARLEGANFDKEHKKLIRNKAVITKDYMAQVNKNWKTNGKLYILDQAATDKYHVDSKRDYDLRIANKQLSSKGLAQLGGALSQIMSDSVQNVAKEPVVKKKVDPPKKEVKKDAPPAKEESEGDKLVRLRAEAKKLGIKQAHVKGIEKLEVAIAEANSQPAS